ncbi:MAG: B12-binding domain-containing radical SAM protein [Candidatus Omnitrophota bacterium]|nr:B12-binding domain-containing radical SAM protein [Candidatus Omnitrophota bacterium]
MKKILLINPWIYDFSAYDFGIKPAGLLRIAEFFRRKGAKVDLVDCLEGCSTHKDEFGFSKIRKERVDKPETLKNIERPYFRYGISINEFSEKISAFSEIDEIYITSGMTYWYPGVHLAIKLLKERFNKTPVILGGIYATICHKHARLTSSADTVWKGNFLDRACFYQNGFYPAYDLLKDREILPLQLTLGCPFRCSYCASRMFSPRFEMKDPVNLFEEAMHYNRLFGTKSFVFYDDALAYRNSEGIKRFLRIVIASGMQFNFYTPNGLHARFIDEELADLFKKTNFRDLRISLETSDEGIQQFTGGKVTNNDLKLALRNLKEAGFSKKDLGVYILMGASYIDMERTMDDILFINSLGAKAILASYSPIPGTLDYRVLVRNKIIKEDIDPIWHNKTIFSELLVPSYIQKAREIRRFTSNLNKT